MTLLTLATPTGRMDGETFRTWLERYAEAWETHDPDLVTDIFTRDGEYHLSPFKAFIGRDEIRDYWDEAAEDLEDVDVTVEVLSVDGDRGIGHFRAVYASGAVTDGVCLVEMDGDRAAVFREWWHKQDS